MTHDTNQEFIQLSKLAHCDELEKIESLKAYLTSKRVDFSDVKELANNYIEHIRNDISQFSIEAFFQQYGLNSAEGIALLSLSEALLRIPDRETSNLLIKDKLGSAKWLNDKDSSFNMMKLSSTALKVTKDISENKGQISKAIEPLLFKLIKVFMRFLGNNFIIGRNINEALSKSAKLTKKGFCFSYDILGEGARSYVQAQSYLDQYLSDIEIIAKKSQNNKDQAPPSISLKLSAIHPKLFLLNEENLYIELIPSLKQIISKCQEYNIAITIDAEETERLDIILSIFEKVILDKQYNNYNNLGIVIQSYHKHAIDIVDYIKQLSIKSGKRIPIRLVKGAYWDSEIKKAQTDGLKSYSVFTKKEHTDISYLSCAYKMIEYRDFIYPQFATHNALTVAEIEKAVEGKNVDFEFQLLFGMGNALYEKVVKNYKCRIYAPVGTYKNLLPYLIRRLLENAASTSFVKNVTDKDKSIESLINDPILAENKTSEIPLPKDIYDGRDNSLGYDLGNKYELNILSEKLDNYKNNIWSAHSLYKGYSEKQNYYSSTSPFDKNTKIGQVVDSNNEDIKESIDNAVDGFEEWSSKTSQERSAIISKAANILEEREIEAIALCMSEAGKSVTDAISEVREAIDFCRYYALQAKKIISSPKIMEGPTGEENKVILHAKGIFFCISPWNFPLAIFTGQVAAALVAGNSVIAKPAEQTPCTAYFMSEIFLEAGIPENVFNLLLGSGSQIGSTVFKSNKISGVAFTGSNETAKIIYKSLGEHSDAIIPLLAETGGQNAMIVDSTALIEQTVDDIIESAFLSAGQRCSALRVLYIQEDIAEDLLNLLSDALYSLEIGDPYINTTDISAVIDDNAKNSLMTYAEYMQTKGKLLKKIGIEDSIDNKGYYVTPHIFEVSSINDIEKENFGPFLHVIKYKSNSLDSVINDINSSGYGLTLGIQTRIESRANYIAKKVKVGNIYINRNITGAVVGVQPFGGENLSGTGPKAGGEHYLMKFLNEKTITTNITAIGGNKDLLL